MSELIFVMTDVVGSTRLWERHPDAMAVSLEHHDRVVQGAMERAGGRVFKHTGDGMIAAFVDADAAAAAAVSGIADLEDVAWGATGPLRIRVSVHAGRAAERGGDYFGTALNKTARINAIGHPGQVLLSDSARRLMRTEKGLDLGEHQLRDLSEPIRLWQLDDAEHPPLRTLLRARHNLPRMPTDFVGRTGEVEEVGSLIARQRLVTITGVGGAGKTRLAVESATLHADHFPGGVWFVDLTPERDGSRVGARALAALRLVQPLTEGPDDPIDALVEATADVPTLLVLDNCEHLIDDVAALAESLLARAPSVTMLATSREALAVPGERVWPIPSLDDAAVELFLNRAEAVGVTDIGDHLDTVERICAELDDIPLAIELAAPLTSSLSVDELAERLDDRFALLQGRRSRRRRSGQQTLQAMMDWSYGLLSDDEQRLLAELSVFTGSFSLEGIEAVATPTGTPVQRRLASLIAQSMVVPLHQRGRYRLLETVRLYALDRLSAAERVASMRDRHLAWIAGRYSYERLRMMPESDHLVYQENARVEIENVVAAMERAHDLGDADVVLSIFLGCSPIWFTDEAFGRVALSWLDRIPLPSEEQLGLRASWLSIAALVHYNLGDLATALDQFVQAAAYVEQLKATDPVGAIIWCVGLRFRGQMSTMVGDLDAALRDADLLDELSTVASAGWMMRWMAWSVRADVYDKQQSTQFLQAAQRALDETIGMSDWAHVSASAILLAALMRERRYEEAISLAQEGLDAPVNVGPVRLAVVVPGVRACAELERFDEALEMIETDFGPSLSALRGIQLRTQLTGLAVLLAAVGRRARLADLASVALHLAPDPVGSDHQRHLWKAILGGEDALNSVEKPLPADLALDRVATVVDVTLDEVRSVLADRS